MIGIILFCSSLAISCVDYAWISRLRRKCINDSFNKLKENGYHVKEENKESIYNELKSYSKNKFGYETDVTISYLSSFPIINLFMLKDLINKEYKHDFEKISEHVLDDEFIKINHILTDQEFDNKYTKRIVYKNNIESFPNCLHSKIKIKKRVLKK